MQKKLPIKVNFNCGSQSGALKHLVLTLVFLLAIYLTIHAILSHYDPNHVRSIFPRKPCSSLRDQHHQRCGVIEKLKVLYDGVLEV